MSEQSQERQSAVAAPETKPSDASRMMTYDASKKSMLLAYLLWFFLGGFGAHRFYGGRTTSAVVMLCLTLVSVALSVVGIGVIGLAIVGLWLLVDLFLVHGWVKNHNISLAARLS